MPTATTARPTVAMFSQTRAFQNIEAAAANLRVEIHRSVPDAQRGGALRALNVLEEDLMRAIGQVHQAPARSTHTNTET